VSVAVETQTTSSSSNEDDANDPATSLSLSLPGVTDSSGEVSDKVVVNDNNALDQNQKLISNMVSFMAEGPDRQVLSDGSGSGGVGFNNNSEFMALMQEMIREEVRSYMMGIGIGKQSNGTTNGGGGGGGGLCYNQAATALGGGRNGVFRNVVVNNRIRGWQD
jgi:myb proto-oncogene protein